MQVAYDRQKSYADLKRKLMDFQVRDKVMLKVSPWKGVVHFGKRRKLNPRYVGPFKVLEKVRSVAYKLELQQELNRVHNTFHVSNLKKCYADEPLAVPLDGLHFDDKLQFVEELVEIIDREVKQLRQSHVPIVKVAFRHFRDAFSVVFGLSFTQGLWESKKLKPGALSLYMGNGQRAGVKAIGVSKNNILYFCAIPRDGIYEIDLSSSNTNASSVFDVSNKRANLSLDSSLLWHCRLGHISKKCIEKLQHDRLLNSTDIRVFRK
ncbi:putative reverse transcriptase domain-containing protein, partial [Tanacetum coccineum]